MALLLSQLANPLGEGERLLEIRELEAAFQPRDAFPLDYFPFRDQGLECGDFVVRHPRRIAPAGHTTLVDQVRHRCSSTKGRSRGTGSSRRIDSPAPRFDSTIAWLTCVIQRQGAAWVCVTILRRAWERGRPRYWYEGSARRALFMVDGVAARRLLDCWRMARTPNLAFA